MKTKWHQHRQFPSVRHSPVQRSACFLARESPSVRGSRGIISSPQARLRGVIFLSGLNQSSLTTRCCALSCYLCTRCSHFSASLKKGPDGSEVFGTGNAGPWRSYCRQHGETCTVVKTASTVDGFSSLLCKKLCHFTLLGHGGTQRTLSFSDEIRMGSGADAVGACCWRA